MGRYNVMTKYDEAQAQASMEERKITTTRVSASPANITPYSIHHLRSRRRPRRGGEITRRNSASSPCFLTTETTATALENYDGVAENCSGVISEVIVRGDNDGDDVTASCCSSNFASSSSESQVVVVVVVVKECTTTTTSEIVADPEVESGETSSRLNERCQSDRESDDQETETKTKSTVQVRMPSESEIEDFFSAAEKDLHKRFSDKYNFDIVKDVPLEGRYEWVQTKP